MHAKCEQTFKGKKVRNEYTEIIYSVCFLIMMEVLKKVITIEPWAIKGMLWGMPSFLGI